MGMYEFGIAIASIFIGAIIWTILLKPTMVIENIAKSFTDESDIKDEVFRGYEWSSNTFFYSFLFISIAVFIWVIKKSVEESRKVVMYG